MTQISHCETFKFSEMKVISGVSSSAASSTGRSIKALPLVLGVFILPFLFVSCNAFLPREIRELEKMDIFSVSADKEAIVLNGVINSSALEEFKSIAKVNPSVKRIEIVNCEGSINDEVNLELAQYIYEQQYDIHLLDNGLIASGGTDLFLAGRKRSKGANTRIGVHSWAGGKDEKATDFPVGHENHLPYITYYKAVGYAQQAAEDFYYFTINAAPADDIHWMTDTEIAKYAMLTAE